MNYRIAVIWKASGKGSYTPMFAGGTVVDDKWTQLTELCTGEASAILALKLVTKGLATTDNIDQKRYNPEIFLDEQGNPC